MICKKCNSEKPFTDFKERGWQWCAPCVRTYKNGLKTKKRRSEGVPALEKKYLTMRVGDNLFKCRKCNEIKAGENFSASQIKPRGRGWCKSCVTSHVRPGNDGHEIWKAANTKYIASGKQKVAHRNWRHSPNGQATLREYSGRRRALVRATTVEKIPRSFITGLLCQQAGRCAICLSELVKYDVDHIVALAAGGKHERSNLQVLCPPCNRRKSAKPLQQFLKEIGRAA